VSGIVAGIDEEGLVSALDETRHGLEDGDFVTFTELVGMEALNSAEPRKVTVKGPIYILDRRCFWTRPIQEGWYIHTSQDAEVH
jgi:hypothetical protein